MAQDAAVCQLRSKSASMSTHNINAGATSCVTYLLLGSVQEVVYGLKPKNLKDCFSCHKSLFCPQFPLGSSFCPSFPSGLCEWLGLLLAFPVQRNNLPEFIWSALGSGCQAQWHKKVYITWLCDEPACEVLPVNESAGREQPQVPLFLPIPFNALWGRLFAQNLHQETHGHHTGITSL